MRKIGFIKIAGTIVGLIVSCMGIVFNIREIATIAGYAVNPSILFGVGFSLFASFMGWIIYSQQKRIHDLEKINRPTISIGSTIGAKTHKRNADSEVDIIMRLGFRNGGNRPAYQINVWVGHAPAQHPELFRKIYDFSSSNRIDSGVEFAIDITMTKKFVLQEDGRRIVRSKDTLVYCGVRYSNSPKDGEWYEDEWWFRYTLGAPMMSPASIPQKEILEPYVRDALRTESIS